jgi:hypothetical protein
MTQLPASAESNAPDLVAAQVQVLNLIYQAQLKQQDVLERIRSQQEQLLKSSAGPGYQAGGGMLANVKVVNFNMPFFALVGLLIKIAVASIPAAIIISVVSSVIAFGIVFVLGLLGVGVSALFRR